MPATAERGAVIRVLCVDDDPEFLDLVEIFLGERQPDIAVETALTGEAAIDRLDEGGPECVISDFRMPGMDGLDLLAAVRERAPDLPFILFTGRGGEDVAAEAVSAGVTDYIQKSTDPDQFDLLANRVRNVVDRHRARVTYGAVFDAISEAVLVIDATQETVVDANQRACELWGYDKAEFAGRPVEDLRVPATTAAASEDDEPTGPPPGFGGSSTGNDGGDAGGSPGVAGTASAPAVPSAAATPSGDDAGAWRCLTKDGRRFWGAISRKRARIDGRERTLVIVRDVTERKVRERHLNDLLATVQHLLVVKTEEEIAAAVERTLDEQLGFREGRVFLLDEAAGGFSPAGDAASVEGTDGSSQPPVDDERLWDALDGGELVVCRSDGEPIAPPQARDAGELTAAGSGYAGEPRLDSGSRLYFPLGEFGVLRGTADAETDHYDIELAALLATFAAGAFDRSRRERELRDREAELRDQRDELLSLDHVNAVIRDINRALVSVSSLEGIEQLVCEKFVATDPYRFAWLGAYDPGASVIRTNASAGRNEGVLSEEIDLGGSTGDAISTAVTERSVVVVDRITPDTVPEERYRLARKRGFRSVAFVPVLHEQVLYRLLAVYADVPNAFAERERAVLGELGETIGHALAAAEWRSARISETVIELDIAVEREGGLFDLTAGGETRIDFTGMRETGAGTLRVFGRLSGATYAAFEATIDKSDALDDPVHLAEREGAVRVAFTLRSGPLLEAVTAGGVSLQRGSIVDGRGRFQLTIPWGTDVRWIVERFRAAFDAVDLLGRRDRDRADLVAQNEGLLATLTDRQEEVLQTAYHAGYFATPREAKGTDVAALLGVTQPTVNEHLRNAERRVVDGLLNSESVYESR